MLLSEQAYQNIDRELTKFPSDQKQSAVIAALAIAQDEKGWLSAEILEDVADYLGMPPILVQEVAMFYNMFNVAPVGKYKITVCTNLPCALRGGEAAAAYLKRKLAVNYNETTADGRFTLKEGECMGACGDAPVLLVNNKHMCVHMSESRLQDLLAGLGAQEDGLPQSGKGGVPKHGDGPDVHPDTSRPNVLHPDAPGPDAPRSDASLPAQGEPR